MSVTLCDGCGRRTPPGEAFCAACGRSVHGERASSPPGWATATVEGADRTIGPENDAAPSPDGEDANSMFLPVGVGRATGSRGSAAVAAAAGGGARAAVPSGGTHRGDVPGGAGWRVRVSAAQAARAAAEAADPERRLGRARSRRVRLPDWVLVVLVAGILVTSVAAAVLIVLHVLRTA